MYVCKYGCEHVLWSTSCKQTKKITLNRRQITNSIYMDGWLNVGQPWPLEHLWIHDKAKNQGPRASCPFVSRNTGCQCGLEKTVSVCVIHWTLAASRQCGGTGCLWEAVVHLWHNPPSVSTGTIYHLRTTDAISMEGLQGTQLGGLRQARLIKTCILPIAFLTLVRYSTAQWIR